MRLPIVILAVCIILYFIYIRCSKKAEIEMRIIKNNSEYRKIKEDISTNSNIHAFMLFTTSWCPNCFIMKESFLEKFNEVQKNKKTGNKSIMFLNIDIENVDDVVGEYGITYVPQLYSVNRNRKKLISVDEVLREIQTS